MNEAYNSIIVLILANELKAKEKEKRKRKEEKTNDRSIDAMQGSHAKCPHQNYPHGRTIANVINYDDESMNYI